MSRLFLAMLLACAFICSAQAQDHSFPTPGNATVPGAVAMCLNSAGNAVPVSSGTCANPAQATVTQVTSPWITQALPASVASYRAVTFGNTAYATPQDLACLQNPANSTKTVYVTQLAILPQQTTAALQTFLFLKRTTLNSGGTSAAATSVALDTNNAAASASLLTYTGAPTPGTSAGVLNEMISTVVAVAANGPALIGLFSESGGAAANGYSPVAAPPGTNTLTQPITLHASEEACVNFNGAALPAGFTAGYVAEWTEH